MPDETTSPQINESSLSAADRFPTIAKKTIRDVGPLRISVIVPTYNEEKAVGALVKHLLAEPSEHLEEVLVIDGGSTDQTGAVARRAGAQVHVAPQKGRARQMNFGVSRARGNVLYFVHADTRPPAGYATDIQRSLEAGYAAGSYRSRFCSTNPLLKINSYFSRFDYSLCRGGDQTLFVTRTLFEQLGGYDDYYIVMEDFDFIRRARRQACFRVMPREAYVSARKYEDNSYGRVTVANFIVFTMFRLGISPTCLLRTYKRMVRYPKY